MPRAATAHWLFKQEPSDYSFADLCRDGRTTWDGVNNALAKQHLRRVKKGDDILFYETGKVKAVVGIMRAAAAPVLNEAEKTVIVQVKPVRPLARLVTLAEIKADPIFAEWELTRQPRLSIMPVSAALWQRLMEMELAAPLTAPG
jgi:predicted RNA-binding protein with PUA-like domain